MFHLKRTICTLLVLATLAYSGTAMTGWATDFWVATTGNDGSLCPNVSRPESDPPQDPGVYKFTIQSAIGCMRSGDRVIVKPGTYTLTSSDRFIDEPPGGTANDYTVIMGQPGQPKPVLQGREPSSHDYGFILSGSAHSYVEINGFEMRDIYQNNMNNILGGELTYVRILNNYIHHTFASAISVNPHGTTFHNYLIKGNEFAYVGYHNPLRQPSNNVLYNVGNGTIIEDNILHNNAQGFTHCGGSTCGGPYPTAGGGIIMRRNICYDQGIAADATWQYGNYASCFASFSGTGNLIYDNIIYNSGSSGKIMHGIMVALSGVNTGVYNNTGYNFANGASDVVNSTLATAIVQNNIGYLTQLGFTGSATFSNNLITNPSFVNPAAGNFHLQSGSAAIDVGANLYDRGVTKDFDGVARPTTGNFSAGAYELAGSVTQAPLAPINLTIR